MARTFTCFLVLLILVLLLIAMRSPVRRFLSRSGPRGGLASLVQPRSSASLSLLARRSQAEGLSLSPAEACHALRLFLVTNAAKSAAVT